MKSISSIFVMFLCIIACNDTPETNNATKAAASPPPCNRFTVSHVPAPIQQPSDWSCWAASLTIMYEWKDNTVYTIDQAVAKAGTAFVNIFKADNGISANEKNQLVSAVGLKAEPPQNFTIDGWCKLLKEKGVLWVTTDELPGGVKPVIHARILYGIEGDGTPGNTKMYFIDPATGRKVDEKFTDFIVKYESELKRRYAQLSGRAWPTGEAVRIQVIHW